MNLNGHPFIHLDVGGIFIISYQIEQLETVKNPFKIYKIKKIQANIPTSLQYSVNPVN